MLTLHVTARVETVLCSHCSDHRRFKSEAEPVPYG